MYRGQYRQYERQYNYDRYYERQYEPQYERQYDRPYGRQQRQYQYQRQYDRQYQQQYQGQYHQDQYQQSYQRQYPRQYQGQAQGQRQGQGQGQRGQEYSSGRSNDRRSDRYPRKLSNNGLRSSEDVYNRLCWDKELEEKMDKNSIIIGYTNFGGNKEMFFNDFKPPSNGGKIGYHQIDYFRTNNKMLWFSRLRLDTIYNSGDTSILIDANENICDVNVENKKNLPLFVVRLLRLNQKQEIIEEKVTDIEKRLEILENKSNQDASSGSGGKDLVLVERMEKTKCNIDLQRWILSELMKDNKFEFSHFLAIRITNPLLIELYQRLTKDFTRRLPFLRSVLVNEESLHVTTNLVSIYKDELMDEMMAIMNNVDSWLNEYLFEKLILLNKSKDLTKFHEQFEHRFDKKFLYIIKNLNFESRFLHCLKKITLNSKLLKEFSLNFKGLNTFNSKVIFFDFTQESKLDKRVEEIKAKKEARKAAQEAARQAKIKAKRAAQEAKIKAKEEAKAKAKAKLQQQQQQQQQKGKQVKNDKKSKWRVKAKSSMSSDCDTKEDEKKDVLDDLRVPKESKISRVRRITDTVRTGGEVKEAPDDNDNGGGNNKTGATSGSNDDGNDGSDSSKGGIEMYLSLLAELFDGLCVEYGIPCHSQERFHCTIGKLSKISNNDRRALEKYNAKRRIGKGFDDMIMGNIFGDSSVKREMKYILGDKKDKHRWQSKSSHGTYGSFAYFNQQLTEISLSVIDGIKDKETGYYQEFCKLSIVPSTKQLAQL